MRFKLHYHVSNNGDGSASVHFHETAEEAEKADSELEEGWGDSSASYIELKTEMHGGRPEVFYKTLKWDAKKKVHYEIWHKIEKDIGAP
jgi:hypothetical protein